MDLVTLEPSCPGESLVGTLEIPVHTSCKKYTRTTLKTCQKHHAFCTILTRIYKISAQLLYHRTYLTYIRRHHARSERRHHMTRPHGSHRASWTHWSWWNGPHWLRWAQACVWGVGWWRRLHSRILLVIFHMLWSWTAPTLPPACDICNITTQLPN